MHIADLMLPSSLATGFALLAVCYLFLCIRSYYRLSHIPGPSLWAWSRWPLIQTHLDGTSYDRFGDLARSYGKLVRIGPNYLLTSNPDIVRRMNTARSTYTKSNWYVAARFQAGVDNMISDRDDKRHEALRRKAAPAYSGNSNAQLEKSVDECVLDLVQMIHDRYAQTEDGKPVPMEFARKTQYFTADTISLLAFSEKFGDLKHDTDHFGYIGEVEALFPNLFCLSVIPELMDVLTATGVLSLFDPVKRNLALGKVMRIANTKINSRLDLEGKLENTHGDMLGSFIKHGMVRQELQQEVMVQM
jgi:cytochrome P450